MRNVAMKSKFLALFLAVALASAPCAYVAEADWTDYADSVANWALKKATPIFLDGLQNWLFDTPVGELLDKAATGDAEAQFALGLMYYEGDRVEKDHAEAAEWWYRAAENGHIKAQFAVGSAYYSGDGVGQDKTEGIKWLRLAAQHGQEDARKVLKEIGISY